MRRTTILMAAAAMAIGSMTLPVGRATAADPTDPAKTSEQGGGINAPSASAAQRGTKASATDERGIRDTLATVVDDATTPGKFRDLTHQFRRSMGSDAHSGHDRAGTSGAREGVSGSGSISGSTDRNANSNPQINPNTSDTSGTGATGASSNQGSGRNANSNPGINPNTSDSGSGTATSGTKTDTNQGAGRDANSNAQVNPNTSGAGTASGQSSDRNDAADAGDTSDLDAKITQLQKDFKAKYNQDLSVRGKEEQVFTQTFAMINTGDFGDAARTAGERQSGSSGSGTNGSGTSGIGAGSSGTGTSGSGTSGSGTPGSGNGTSGAGLSGSGTSGSGTGSSGIGSGRTTDSGVGTSGARTASDRGDSATRDNYATVVIPASQSGAGAGAVNLRLVNEGGQWKIDAPRLDRKQLKMNLAKHLDMADQEKDKWPSDVNDAYRSISQHVLMAVSDTVSSGQTGAGAGSDASRSGTSGSGTSGSGIGTGTSTGSNPK